MSARGQRYTGRTVLITGAAAGIGAATAQRLVEEGARVALVDRDAAALQALAQGLGEAASCHAADVSCAAQTAQAFADILARHGQIDAAVLSAGVASARAPLHRVRVEDFDRVMAVNVRGVFLWLARCMEQMLAQRRGAVAVLSSTSGLRATRHMSPYTTSKHAVIGLMKAAALEGADSGVRVNCVNPGPTDTAMMQGINAARGELQQVRAQSQAGVPMGRYGTPAELAALIAFLCSDEAAFCTGATYLADGGIMAGT